MAESSHYVRGDFQTPVPLAQEVWSALGDLSGVGSVIEPTVGTGAFLRTAPTEMRARPWVCFDINADHVASAAAVARECGFRDVQIHQKDAFELHPDSFSGLNFDESLLAIGNPPWVTSSSQASATSKNLPSKSNEQFGLRGLDALTGKANFDIAEAVLLRLLMATHEFKEVRLAFLIKRSVAMKLSQRLLGVATELSFSPIDAKLHFDVAVDAGLFIARRAADQKDRATHVAISTGIGHEPSKRAGFHQDRFVSDLDAHASAAHLEAADPVPWRQGVKHDLAKILELTPCQGGWENGLGELVTIEPQALCPLYKSSDLANGRSARRVFPLFQEDLSGPVIDLEARWPLLAAYLQQHEQAFEGRRSKIYANKAPFSIFGIGPYTLAPWKVAVSGLYSSGQFRVLGPTESGQPPLVDDTCYLLPYEDKESAEAVADHLNGADVQRLLQALISPGSKRPLTKAILSRLAIPVQPSEGKPGSIAAPSLAITA